MMNKTFHLLTISLAGIQFGAWGGDIDVLLDKKPTLRLVQELTNEHDPHAIRVDSVHNAHGDEFFKVGYVPAAGSTQTILNRILSAGYELTGVISDNSDGRQVFVHVHMKAAT